jgi:hypothetical protein
MKGMGRGTSSNKFKDPFHGKKAKRGREGSMWRANRKHVRQTGITHHQ